MNKLTKKQIMILKKPRRKISFNFPSFQLTYLPTSESTYLFYQGMHIYTTYIFLYRVQIYILDISAELPSPALPRVLVIYTLIGVVVRLPFGINPVVRYIRSWPFRYALVYTVDEYTYERNNLDLHTNTNTHMEGILHGVAWHFSGSRESNSAKNARKIKE